MGKFYYALLLILAIFLNNSTLNADVTKSLNAWWKFDETSGLLANDSSGYQRNGVIQGSVLHSTNGKFGNCLLFNGAGYINLGTEDFGLDTAFSISVWVNAATLTPSYQTIIQRGKYCNPFYLLIEGQHISAKIRLNNSTRALISTNIAVNQWYNIVYTYSKSNHQHVLYLNGVETSRVDTLTGSLNESVDSTYIGNNHGTPDYFQGMMDDIRIYKRALTPADISEIYNGAIPEKDTENPSVPQKLDTILVSCNQVQLKWENSNDNVGVYGYEIYRNNILVGTSSENSYSDVGLSMQTEYTYKILAFDLANNKSDYSNAITIETIEKPANWPTARFIIEPNDTVEVGELVLFDASTSTDDQRIRANEIAGREARFEWEFGDGYGMRHNKPDNGWDETGISCVHYFMKPGTYNVKLIMSDFETNDTIPLTGPSHIDVAIRTIVVKGEAPIEGFELWHAPFHSRIAQYIYAQIPKTVYETASNKLVVKLLNEQEETLSNLLDKSNLAYEEVFLLENYKLPAGKYILSAELLDGEGKRISIIREKFSKTYEGKPQIGIDENNAICINSKPTFITTPYLIGPERMPFWSHFVNVLNSQGNNPSCTPNGWNLFLDSASHYNLLAMGPESNLGWENKGPARNTNRNADLNSVRSYVDQSYNKNNILGWLWDDEPNMGYIHLRIPSAVYGSWDYISQTHDANAHPVISQLAGYNFLPYYIENQTNEVIRHWIGQDAYLYSAPYFGGKKYSPWQITGGDVYPIEASWQINLKDAKRGIYDLWSIYVDNISKANYDLLPTIHPIEIQEVLFLTQSPYVPTPEQIRMNSWIGIIHGMKGISYFHYFGTTPPESYLAISELKKITDDLDTIILGPVPKYTVTDNANTRGSRVDAMIRETKDAIYVFAIRVSEPDFECDSDKVAREADSTDVEFTLGGIPKSFTLTNVEDITGKYKKIIESHGATSESQTLNFELDKKPVEGSLLIAAKRTDQYDPWVYGFDDGKGGISGYVDGVTLRGTINYSTSAVHFESTVPIKAGKDSILTIYTPIRNQRLIPVYSNKFKDKFEREGLRIYKIPKEGIIIPENPDKAEKLMNDNFRIFPNPAKNTLMIHLPKTTVASNIQIINLVGNVVYESQVEKNTTNFSVDISSLKPGLYYISAISGNNRKTMKFIKE